MKLLRKNVSEHRLLFTVIILGFTIFINCFGFPVYNFEKEWPPAIVVEYLLIPMISSIYIGGGFALLYPQKHARFVLLLLLVFTGIGMGCRFLLEFGEVSNTYNFTLPNILLHLFVMIGLSFLSWLHTKRLYEQ